MVVIKFEVDQASRSPYVLPQSLNNKFKIETDPTSNRTIVVKNPRGLSWKLGKFQVNRVVEIVLGCKSIAELKKDYESFKNQSLFKKKIRKILHKLIKRLKDWEAKL